MSVRVAWGWNGDCLLDTAFSARNNHDWLASTLWNTAKFKTFKFKSSRRSHKLTRSLSLRASDMLEEVKLTEMQF